MTRRHLLLAVLLVLTSVVCASPQAAPRGRIQGKISDSSGLPLPGVTVSLTFQAGVPLVVHTDAVGGFEFDVPRGQYTLTAELEGFKTVVRPNLLAGSEPLVVAVVLELGGFATETQVIAQAPRVFTTAEPTAPATVDREIIKMAPVAGMRYDSALPLLPGAVRGPDGLISISGTRSFQGTVLVDRMRESDQVTGEPRLSIPITAIDTVQVYSPLPPAEAGPATGGVTMVNTKAALDTFAFNVLGLFPRPRFSGNGTSGIESWQPTFGFSGPLSKGRVWLNESLEYRYEKYPYTTVAGKEDSRVHGFTSFTRLDVKPRGPHHFTLRLLVTPDSTRHYGLGGFAPADTVPDVATTGISVAALDRVALGDNSTLDSHVHVKRLVLTMSTTDGLPYVVGHDRIRGTYFKWLDRTAYRFDFGTTVSRRVANWHGEHLIKAGFSVGYMTVNGAEASRPVEYIRSDFTRARGYDFGGAGRFDASLADAGLFLQDTWSVGPGLKAELGARIDANSSAAGTAVWPRAGLSYDLRPNSTKLSTGFGVFTDKSILGPRAFPQRQWRRETLYDRTGGTATASTLFMNEMDGALRMPRSVAWNVQLDQTLPRGWMARANYQERYGAHEYVVQPRVLGPGAGTLSLNDAGETTSRSFEVTAGFRSEHGSHQFYLSYVRSSSRGNLNDLNTVGGYFSAAQVLPDARGPLPADVPHRMLSWAVISLPLRITLSPLLEVRTGFPFTRIDEDWNVVGTRGDSRFPVFASFDLAVEKAVLLPWGLPAARVGVKLFNVTNRNNGRAIQRDVERSDFGTVYDPVGRALRGTLEFSWNK